MPQSVKELIAKHRFTNRMLRTALGRSRHQVNGRLSGASPWTAPEVVRFHKYLKSQGVNVDLGKLTRMCAADHGSE